MTSGSLFFDTEASQILRQAARLAGERRATIEHLRRALDQPAPEMLPEARLRGDSSLTSVLQRAYQIAADHKSKEVSRRHLYEALVEQSAITAGIDLNRLLFARWRVQRHYPMPARLRKCAPGRSMFSTLKNEEEQQ